MGINKAYNPRNAPPEKMGTAHFFFAINIASLTSVDQFKEEMDEQIRTTRKAEPRAKDLIELRFPVKLSGNLLKSAVQTVFRFISLK